LDKIHFETDSLINWLHSCQHFQRDSSINLLHVSTQTRHWESRNHTFFSSGTNLGSTFLCTNLDKIHFETDSLINLLHVSTLVHDIERVRIRHHFLLVQIWAQRISVRFLDKIHFETDSLINLLHVSTLVHDIGRVKITHYFLLVQIWVRKFCVQIWTRFIPRQTHSSICYTAVNAYRTLGE